MVSRNNRIKRMEEAAERQSHFGIRKLTVGAASVLLGTTLWMGTNANSAQAATNNDGHDKDVTDESHSQKVNSVDTSNAKSTVIEVQKDTQTSSQSTTKDENQADAQAVEKANKAADVDLNNANSAQATQKQADAKTSEKAATKNSDSKVDKTESNTADIKKNAETALQIQKQKAEKAQETAKNAEKQTSSAATDLTKASKDADKTADASLNNSTAASADLIKQKGINGANTAKNSQTGEKDAEKKTDLSNTGLDGKTTNAKIDTKQLDLLRSAYVSLTGNNKVDVSKYSAKQLEQMLSASLVQANSTSNGSAVDLDTFNPDFKHNMSSNQLYNGQLKYAEAQNAATGDQFVYTTDVNDPGKTLYFYRGGSLVQSLSASDATIHWQFTVNDTFNNSSYTGGTYNLTKAIASDANYYYIRYDFTDANGSSPVTIGVAGEVRAKSDSGQFNTYFLNGHAVEPLPIADQRQPSLASPTTTMANQTITYINADTGEIMKHVESDKVASGSSYDVSGDALDTITYKGKTYNRVTPENVQSSGRYNYDKTYTSSNISDAAINKIIMNNNGLAIKAGDVYDEPLTGTLGASRKGDTIFSLTSFKHDLVYILQQTDNKGTADLNSYTLQSSDTRASNGYINQSTYLQTGGSPTGLSANNIPSGGVFGGGYGPSSFHDANAVGKNGAYAGHQDIVFFYREAPATKQNADVIFVDDDNNETEIPGTTKQSASGDAGSQISFTGADGQVTTAINQGYTYVGTTGTGVTGGTTASYSDVHYPVYDNDTTTDQHFVVHFRRKNNPPTPTNNYHATQETETVTRTINYYDKVTGQKIPANVITKAGSNVTNPTITSVNFVRNAVYDQNNKLVGYGNVNSQGKFVPYDANDPMSKTAGWETDNGMDSGRMGGVYSPDLTSQSYTAPTGGLDATAETPDDGSIVAAWNNIQATDADRVYNIYYGHKTENVDQDKTFTRKFHYIFTDSTTEGQTSDGRTYSHEPQTVTLKGHATKDLLTGQISNVTWDNDSATMDGVPVKNIDGYKIVTVFGGPNDNKENGASKLTLTPTSDNPSDVTFIYTPFKDYQKAKVTIVDVENGESHPVELTHFTNDLGEANTPIVFTTANSTGDGSQQALTSYLKSGYEFVRATTGDVGQAGSNIASGSGEDVTVSYGNFDNDSNKDQYFTIYLKHKHNTWEEPRKTTATVKYIVEGNDPNKPKAPDDNVQTVDWTRHDDTDLATGVTTHGDWTLKTPGTTYNKVDSPTIPNYTPSQNTVTFDTPDVTKNPTVIVTYTTTPKVTTPQKATVEVIDKTDGNKSLGTFNNDAGKTGDTITFQGLQPTVQAYLNNGYKYDSAQDTTNGTKDITYNTTDGSGFPVFDNVDDNTQSFKIYLVHGTKEDAETGTSKAHVHYVMSDGTKAPDDSSTQTINWTRTNTVDAVDGHVIKHGDWTIENNSPKTFTDVKSPDVTGYTPDQANVHFDAPQEGIDQNVTVVYTPVKKEAQKANLKIVDDTNNTTLVDGLTATGDSGEQISFPSEPSLIKTFTDNGYDFVKLVNDADPNTAIATSQDGVKFPKFDNDTTTDQNFTIHLTKKTEPTKPTVIPHKTIIKYDPSLTPGQVVLHQKGEDGEKTGDKVTKEAKDEIIYVAKQTATVHYYYQGGDADNSAVPVKNADNQDLIASITGVPVETDASGNIVFDENGNTTPNTINYGNYDKDLSDSKNWVANYTGLPLSQVRALDDEWKAALDANSNKYYNTGLNKAAIIAAAERAGEGKAVVVGPTEGPNYKIILGCGNWESKTGTLTVNYIDKDTGEVIHDPNKSLSVNVSYITNNQGVSYNGRPNAFNNGTKVDLANDQWNANNGNFTYGYTDLPDLSSEGYKFDSAVAVDPKTGQKVLSADSKQVGGITTTFANNYNATINVYYTKPKAGLQNATLKIVDKTANKTLVDGLTDSGEAGTQISFPSEKSLVDAFINQGYKFDSATDGTNSIGDSADNIKFPVFDNTADNNGASQNFTIYLVHTTEPVDPNHPGHGYSKTDLDKKVTRTINYLDQDGNTIAPSTTKTVEFKGSGVVDKVTGQFVKSADDLTPLEDQSKGITWTYTVDGQTSNGNTYKFDATSEKPTIGSFTFNHVDNKTYDGGHGAVKEYDVDATKNPQDLTVNVIYSKAPDKVTYHSNTENKTVTRVINYIDKTTDKAIPADLAPVVTQTATISRTQIIDSTGKVIGYGSLNDDGTYTLAKDQNNAWTTDDKSWTLVTSPDLAKYGYTAPDKAQVDKETVDGNTKDKVINVYYGHTYVPVTPDNPKKPTDPVNPDDPNSPKYPDGLTKEDLEQTVTRIIHYVGVNSDGTTTAVNGSPDNKSDYTQTVTFTKHAIIDKVTGKLMGYDTNGDGKADTDDSNRAWMPNSASFEEVDSQTPASVKDKDGKAFDAVDIPTVSSTSVLPGNTFQDITVTYRHTPKTPVTSYNGKDDTKTVTRTIVYKDKVTQQDIPSSLAKPQIQTVTLHRTIITDNNGKFVGYGTVSADGKSYTIDPKNPEGWNTGDWAEADSPDLAEYGYTAPDKSKIDKVTVTGATENDSQVVWYGHQTIPVTPDNPKKPTDPVNPKDPDGPKYPQGVDKDQLNKTVTRTINYVDDKGNKVNGAPDGTSQAVQTVKFTRTAIIDKVTGQLLGYDINGDGEADTNDADRAWNPISGSFDEVTSKTPKDVGYDSVDKSSVNKQTVTPTDEDTTVTVVYSKNPTPTPVKDQAAQVIYRDLDNNKQAIPGTGSGNLTGKAGSEINYNTADTIADLVKKGYVLVNNGFDPDGQKQYYDNNDDTTQTFYVDFRHKTIPVTPDKPVDPNKPVDPDNPDNPTKPAPGQPSMTKTDLEKTVTRTIHYVEKNNVGNVLADPITETVTFTRHGVIDTVTGKLVNLNSDGTIKDENGTLSDWTYTSSTGKSGSDGKYTFAQTPDAEYINKNGAQYKYDSVSDDQAAGNGAVKAWDATTDSKDQDVIVYYTKQTSPVTKQGSVTVVFHDDTDDVDIPGYGTKTGEQKVGTSVGYTSKTDLETLESKGYVYVPNADDQVPTTINEGDKTVTIHVKHGTVPVTPDKPGKPGEPVNPKDPHGPEYPSGTDAVSLTKNVTRTVTYIVSDGKAQAPSPVSDTLQFEGKGYIDKVNGHWVTVDKDGNVTGSSNGLTWTIKDGTKDEGSFAEVNTPALKGYHVVSVSSHNDGKNNVAAINGINHNSSDINVQVVYVPDETPVKQQGSLTVVFHDDTDGVDIPDVGTKTGNVDEGTKVTYSPDTDLQNLENHGYVYVSTDGKIPTEITKGATLVTIHVKHATRPVTPDNPVDPDHPVDPNHPNNPSNKNPQPGLAKTDLEKNIDRHVTYIFTDGTKPDAHGLTNRTQTVKYHGEGTIDLVTGNLVTVDKDGNITGKGSINWTTDNNKMPVVASHAVDGYHITGTINANNDGSVKGLTVGPNDIVQDATIIYSPNEKPAPTDQKAHLTIIDRNDASNPITMNAYNDGGKENTAISFSGSQDYVQDLINRGYVIDGFKVGNGSETKPSSFNDVNFGNFDNDSKTDQDFTLYLVHGHTTVTPNEPGHPGDPVDPDNPTGPKYPSGTDEQSVKRVGTQTVHYVGAGDKTPVDKTQNVTFTRTITFDNVTGKITENSGWSEKSHTFGYENTPIIDGYHADKKTAGGTTVTPDDLNKTVTVTYSQNGKIVPVDPEGHQIPGTDTPTFPTDPQDPTKVVTGKIPNVPTGWTPVDPNNKPGNPISPDPTDPGKDVPVPFNPVTPTPDQGSITVVVHDSTSNVDLPDYGKTSGNEDVGTKFTYDKTTTIKDLENKGYKVINPDVTVPGEIAKGNQVVTIYVEHNLIPVTPDKPGKPGEPINPNDPDSPKWPDGTDKDSLTRTGTQTVHYVGAGDKTPKDNVTSVTFEHHLVYDKVTGKLVTDEGWTPGSHTFETVNTPVVDGYHADKKTAGGTTVTPDDLNKTVTVTYSQNGKIVPVDPEGHQIPGTDTPTFPTDPQDPTKVVTGKIPNVPTGWTPVDPNNKPGNPISPDPTDPGKDVPVPFNPVTPVKDQGSITVVVHDSTSNVDLPNYGKTSGKEDVGTKFTYDKTTTIKDLENKGYKVINPDVTIPGEITKGDTVVTITVEHNLIPVTPDKPGKPGEPINPNDPDSPKWPDGTDKDSLTKTGTQTVHYQGAGNNTPKDSVTTVTFEHHLVYDKVTGKLVTDEGWTPDTQTYTKITTPVIPGYTADKDVVGGDTVNVNGNIDREYTVVYTPDTTPVTPVTPSTPTVTTVDGKQTITFVDGDNGNTPLRDPDVQNHTFTITDGVPSENSFTFGTINVPVIDGYVAEVKTAGGKTVTPDNPEANVVVVYHKIGKIVPVDKDHNPIPGADTPKYKNDPNDPTKVVPDEPVPTIDGYTPNQNTVTPQDPTKDTEVVYTKPEEPKKTPDEPDEPEEPTTPTPTPKKHHDNNKPKPSKPATPKKTNWSTNNAPHAQNGYWNNNIAPHGQSVNGWSNNIGPHGEHVDANGNIVAPNGEIIGYVDANGNPHYTKALPQTGSNDKQSQMAALLGGAAAGLSMIGLAGVKKRRKRD